MQNLTLISGEGRYATDGNLNTIDFSRIVGLLNQPQEFEKVNMTDMSDGKK